MTSEVPKQPTHAEQVAEKRRVIRRAAEAANELYGEPVDVAAKWLDVFIYCYEEMVGAPKPSTSLVQLRYKRIKDLEAALEQALDCILDETPEDMTREEAREDTISKIRAALLR